jgi:hypothetical protein
MLAGCRKTCRTSIDVSDYQTITQHIKIHQQNQRVIEDGVTRKRWRKDTTGSDAVHIPIYLAAADELEDAVDPSIDGGAPLLNDPGSAGPRGSSHGSPPPAHRRDAPDPRGVGRLGARIGTGRKRADPRRRACV